MSDAKSDVQPLFTYTIGGVKIEMPVRPYPSQVSMMDKVIRGCQKQQNCLLESPTGSGKTLALLCSALAWQRAEKERLEKLSEEEFQQKLIEWQQKEQQKKQQKEKKQKKLNTPEKKLAETNVLPAKNKGLCLSTDVTISDDSEEEMAIFKQPVKKRKINNSKDLDVSNGKSKSNDDSIMTDDSSANNSLMTEDEDENNEPKIENNLPKKTKAITPVIYFCTRTHKQIEQVIKELQRTSFNNARSCVLASREHTCIQDSNIYYPQISYKSKTELCRDLLDPRARRRNSIKLRRQIDRCNYYDNGGVKISTYGQLAKFGVSSVWDIEDIVHLGITKHSCPYYGTRLLLKTAEIVFCPYNYIIDPVIRRTMNLKLKGHVIIVDEAHNIEDQCRDAASLQLDQTNMNLAKADCEKICRSSGNSVTYGRLARYLSDLSKWIDEKSNDIKTYDEYNRGVLSWSGTYTIASFDDFGVGLKAFEMFKKDCDTALADLAEENESDETKNSKKENVENELGDKDENETIENNSSKDQDSDSAITNATKTLLSSICSVFSLFYDEKYKYDYHVSLVKVMHLKKFEHKERGIMTGIGGWLNSGPEEPKDTRPVWNNVVSFLCLNPAAVFDELKSTVRNIILTSGTLSPMQSFQSELGTQFPIALEAAHVIKRDQCWVTSVGVGPTGTDLNGQFQNINTYGYQDEMGKVLLDVCTVVPHGVLCFMPSYTLMEKLYNRWQLTGLLTRLNHIKVVMCEPRRGDQLEELMAKYYAAVRGDEGGPRGALFLAVYRGKISEGLDFSDNNARAVVAVGIPFPNYKEESVKHKKDYNNKHHKNKGLLPGWEWYQIQAYRALNQALGRCIRHKNDWGAILLVDSRYEQPKNQSGLSKWIRGRVENNSSWSTIVAKLKNFVETRQLHDSTAAALT
ncbi:Fanconi anemia group J protein homolog isoform X1 [Rhopalosiphum padi]|uniref:Fanconi anemia group J protein homolog isoform X1 n=2 Tax=Rhopalosiphum padi TaxID=40932 RepID=UPI00298E17D6|nr:Fanconi anemia group J protein homolog isoform X1 [Rhopalosiphum padi]